MADEAAKEPVKSIKLKHPVSWTGGEVIDIVDFHRRVKAKDVKGMDLNNLRMEEQCKILANITNLETPQLYELDLEDMIEVGKVLQDFLGIGQET